MLIKQTHTKPEEIKLLNSRGIFNFKPLISIEGSWMIGVTVLEVYCSFFNITEKNSKFELHFFLNQKM